MGIYAVQGFFIYFNFGFSFPLPTHNHPPSRLGAGAVDPLSRAFPFISDALDHGGQLCPRVSSSTLSQPHLSLSLVSHIFLYLLCLGHVLMVLFTHRCQISHPSRGKSWPFSCMGFESLRTEWMRTNLRLSLTARRNHGRHLQLFIPSL